MSEASSAAANPAAQSPAAYPYQSSNLARNERKAGESKKGGQNAKAGENKSAEYVGSTNTGKTGGYNKNGVRVDFEAIKAAKADMKNNAGAFKRMVETSHRGRVGGHKSKDAAYWSKWVKEQLGQQYSVAEAKSLVADDGYWGVEQTSQRIVDFAKSLAGGDMSNYDKLLDAIKKGFGAAKDAWGGEMPEITGQTYNAVMEKMQAWKDEEDKKNASSENIASQQITYS